MISLDLDRISVSYWADGRVTFESDENLVECDRESAVLMAQWIIEHLTGDR